MLDWLVPPASGPVETVAVAAPDGHQLQIEDGIVGRSELLAQLRAAEACIARHQPERMAVSGGDCLVDLALFAYLNERQEGELAVLWIDAHPDITTPRDFSHAHAMVPGNLLGEGNPDFKIAIRRQLRPSHVITPAQMKCWRWRPQCLSALTCGMLDRVNWCPIVVRSCND
ncbi:arginase family protein [Paraburkholderia tropica]|uniref:arginase family protein n=1 Tax=Paraburkholderia tropica TaxID=92647 RepID=UPI002AB6741E|nr:arginase family protein [Paraburkholderia tropica]